MKQMNSYKIEITEERMLINFNLREEIFREKGNFKISKEGSR